MRGTVAKKIRRRVFDGKSTRNVNYSTYNYSAGIVKQMVELRRIYRKAKKIYYKNRRVQNAV